MSTKIIKLNKIYLLYKIMNVVLKLIFNFIAMMIGAIAIAKISEFFGANSSEFIIFYAYFLVCWIFYLFLPQKYSFFKLKVNDAEADYGGGEQEEAGLIDRFFLLFDSFQNRIPKIKDQEVFTSDERGIIDMILPQGAGLPRYRDTEGPLQFLAAILDPDTGMSLQESEAKALLGTRIGNNLTGYLKKLAEIQGKSFDSLSAAAKRVGLTRTASRIDSVGSSSKNLNTNIGNYLSSERQEFGSKWEKAKQANRENKRASEMAKLERGSTGGGNNNFIVNEFLESFDF